MLRVKVWLTGCLPSPVGMVLEILGYSKQAVVECPDHAPTKVRLLTTFPPR
jgi:hypothetical protein